VGSRAFEPVLGDAHNEIRWLQLAALGTRPGAGHSRHNGYRRAVTPHDPEDRPTPAAPYSRYGAPAPLAAAAALTAVQGLVTTLLGIAEMFSVAGDRVVMGVTTALFFVAYGVGLVVCAWGLHRCLPWSRGPVLFAELIWLLIAWSFRGGDTLVIAIAVAVSAVLVLAGLLSPASVAALNRPERQE
jgi:hypothetical protein